MRRIRMNYIRHELQSQFFCFIEVEVPNVLQVDMLVKPGVLLGHAVDCLIYDGIPASVLTTSGVVLTNLSAKAPILVDLEMFD